MSQDWHTPWMAAQRREAPVTTLVACAGRREPGIAAPAVRAWVPAVAGMTVARDARSSAPIGCGCTGSLRARRFLIVGLRAWERGFRSPWHAHRAQPDPSIAPATRACRGSAR